MQPQRKKRRVKPGPNKNELRLTRQDREERERSQSGTLRSRFPDVQELAIELRIESTAGATLEESSKQIGLDDAFQLNVECPGGCGGGHFLLTQLVESMLEAHSETRQGVAVCQAASYNDPRLPCSTKLHYGITISYDRSASEPEA